MKINNPPKIELSGLVWTFAHRMQEQLNKNANKRGWEDLTPWVCIRRMRQELKEVEDAHRRGLGAEAVIRECADLSNFAAFLAANYGK